MGLHGLIHRKRKCPFCLIYDMHLFCEPDAKAGYIWKCTHCFDTIQVTQGTILHNLNVKRFDASLTLWMMNCRTTTAARIVTERVRSISQATCVYDNIFRKAYSHYAQEMVLPYLTLPGGIEIDESKVNHKRFQCLGNYITVRWMFGMYCRKTRICIAYCIRDKSMNHIIPIMKRHVPPGGIVYSDSHMSYCNLMTGISKLSQFGWYHMWTNHSL